MICPTCGSEAVKFGHAFTSQGKIQRYKCKNPEKAHVFNEPSTVGAMGAGKKEATA